VKKRRDERPLAAYLRVSTTAQATSGIGLEAQRQAIKDAAASQGFVVSEWFEDAGRSGSSMARRSGLRDALSAVEAGRVGGLVTAKIDRLGRSSADVCGLVERAQRERWRLVALDVGLDSTTAAGELVAAALAMAARLEYRRISERQLEKHDELRRQGRPRGRPAVPGEVADAIRRQRESGLSLRAIAAALNAEDVPRPQGGTRWHASTVRAVLHTRARELAVAGGSADERA
jgi:DNA invertase Pin-like site-specific DNA recombinase